MFPTIFISHPGSLTPLLRMLIGLRFLATGTFLEVVGDLIGITKTTAHRTVELVLDALMDIASIRLPNQEAANRRELC